ncbi:TusE/DsrC/DsvC family sulfur relay protein [Sodalis sp. CWE]|uniref:TusE/DsrC/DsvC family sulfur relay protein n=1 Tax=Sodalis sp. CWE TaxID=2803816 RepID=UPI001C7D2ACE|nr:TusE/DsrC/DsvC family sulfur relay protein [Sodalis sp. CWE]MBX4181032.1 TusE/DsrC/DsvC family sulfur relay protein [Sodalis sp. CWE]
MKFNGTIIETDTQGYLISLKDWSESLAKEIACQEGIFLNENHWQVIYFIREFYLKYNISPTMRMLVKFMTQNYGEKKGNSRYLFSLFPKGPAKQATKIAGLPKSVRCL